MGVPNNVTPAGRLSVSSTPVATSGPWLVTNVSNVTTCPTLGSVSFTDFETSRSTRGTETDAVAESFVESVSNWSADWNVAVLDMDVPAADDATVPVIVRVALADAARDGIFQFGAV